MRILATIPHYFHAEGAAKHGSQGRDPRPRAAALVACLASLRQHFGRPQLVIDIQHKIAYPIHEPHAHQLDILVCTTLGRHLLGNLNLPANFYMHHETQVEPMLLGFACQAVLRDRLGQYDYYCFLEDDLILHDPWFFSKLAWFTKLAGEVCLLQPNRYEASTHGPAYKVYVDGQLRPQATARYQNVEEQPEIAARICDEPVRFVRARNPHSGGYFLNAQQMEHWTRQPHFLDGDASFVGPLESAATLGIMKTFRIYKPAPECAGFLEIHHYGSGFLNLLGQRIPIHRSAPGAASAAAASWNAMQITAAVPSPPAAPSDVTVVKINARGKEFPFQYPRNRYLDTVLSSVLKGHDYPLLPLPGFAPASVVDIGANVGASAVYFHLAYPAARVFAYEPSSRNFTFLQENVLPFADWIQIHQCGLLDRDDELPLHAGVQHPALDSLIPGVNTAASATERVRVRRASQALAEHGLQRIGILKIDTEGCEVPILRDLWAGGMRADLLYIEYHSEEDRRTLDGLLAPDYLLARARVGHLHRGTLVYLARELAQRYPGLEREKVTPGVTHPLADLEIAGPGPAAWEQIVGFFTVEEARAVQAAVRQLPPGAVVAELGTFQGRSAVAIASVLPPAGVLHCIDHFQGSLLRPGEPKPTPQQAVERNLAALQRNLDSFGVKDRVQVHALTTTEAARLFEAQSLDLLFIDAGHDYDSVRADLLNWVPKLKPGGWLFCDDYEAKFPGVIRALDESGLSGELAAPSLWRHRRPGKPSGETQP